MKHVKKLIAMLLVLAMVFCMAGCGGGGSTTGGSAEGTDGAAVAFCALGTSIGLGTINKATQHVEGIMRGMENVSTGYLYASYGRQISWSNGKLNIYSDTAVVIEVDGIEIATKTGGAPNLNHGKQESEHDGFILDSLKIQNNNGKYTATLPLTYLACSSSRTIPANIKKTTIIEVSEMEDETLKRILDAAGIKSLTIPRFISIDNELFQYQYDTSGKGILYTNYEDVLDDIKKVEPNIAIEEDELVDVDGYAYILATQFNENNYIVPVSHTNYLKDTYNIDRTVQREVKCSVSNSGDPKLQVKYWIAQVTNQTATTGQIPGTLKYYGPVSPNDEYSLPRTAIQDDRGNLWYWGADNANYYSVKDNAPFTGDIANTTNCTVYFSLSGTGASLNVLFIPAVGSGCTASQVGAAESYYFVPNQSGNYTINCDFGFCADTKFNVSTETRNIYSNEDFGLGGNQDEFLANTDIQLYYYNKDKSGATDNSDFFTKYVDTDGKPVTLLKIKQNLSKYAELSTNNEIYTKVGEVFSIDGNGRLLVREADDKYLANHYRSDEGDLVSYVYEPVFSGVEMGNYTVGKYVYNTMIGEEQYKLYTRFKYDGAGQSFLPYRVNGQSISDILLPTSGQLTKDVIFAESVRVSLSIGDRDIYFNAETGDKSDAQHGTINCELPTM